MSMGGKNKVNPEKSLELQVLLAEYNSLRDEAKNCDTVQMLVATICMTVIGALFSANIFFKTPETQSRLALLYLFWCLIPWIIMFFGIIWIDQLYRRMRFGAYLYSLEVKINKLFVGEPRMNWEHWIVSIEKNDSFFKPSHLYGYIISGSWIFMPFLIFSLANSIFSLWKIGYDECLSDIKFTLLFGVTILALIIYVRFYILFIYAIYELKLFDRKKK